MKGSRRERLTRFLRERIESADKNPGGALKSDTSLIRSQLLDSLGLLHLAAWIEEETRRPLDVADIDPAAEWDTIADIERFIDRRI
jgi:hypothetical protein